MQNLKVAYSITEAERALGLSHQSVYNELNAGRLRSFKIGRRRFITEEALRDYVSEREAESA